MVLDRDVAEAATYGDVDFIEDWLQNLDRPEDINEVDKKGRTVLSLCVMGVDNHFNDHGDASVQLEDEVAAVIMILAKGGADVNLADKYGWTPLHHACDSHRLFGIAVIPALLAAGANVNAKTTDYERSSGQDPSFGGFGVVAPVQTPLATAIDWFRVAGVGDDWTRTGLEYVSMLLRHGASLDNCWAGAPVENLLRHVEDRTTPAMEMWFGNDHWAADTPEDLSQNEDFLACKALVKKARSEPRKSVLTLRALALKGRAKPADPVLKFLADIPDGVAGNVLSFWPPAARYYAVRRPGTGQVPFRPKSEVEVVKAPPCPRCGRSNHRGPEDCPGCLGNRLFDDKRTENVYHSISASAAYIGKSFEELRLEDYDQARDEGKWWPGGPLQINTGLPPLRVFPTGHVPYRPWRDPEPFSTTSWVEFTPEGDARRKIQIHIDLVYDAITMMPEYRGKSFEELRFEDYQQGNQVRRVCADCGRSLARENYSNTQWIKKRVGDSLCKECIGDLSGLAPTLASLRFD